MRKLKITIFYSIFLLLFLSCQSSNNNPVSSTSIKWKDTILTLDHEKPQLKEYAFIFTNSGACDLIFYRVYTECGCTAVSFPQKTIKPGGTDSIIVKIHGTAGEYVNKAIYVSSNTNEQIKTLHFKGVL